MRSLILILGLAFLLALTPARKAEALAGYYVQFHRSSAGPKTCPNRYRWDAQAAKCRRIS